MKRRWSRGEKWLMIGSGGACLLTFGVGWAYRYQNELPPLIPEVVEVAPQNNASNLIEQAVAVLPPMPATESYPPGPPNAIWYSNIKPTGFDSGGPRFSFSTEPLPYTPEYNKVFPLAKKVAYLKASQRALRLWRQSVDMPPHKLDKNSDFDWQQSSAKRGILENTVLIQARACWQQGDNMSALKWLLLRHRGACRDDSIEMRKIITGEIQQLMPLLSATELRYAAKELQRNRKLLLSTLGAIKDSNIRHMVRMQGVCARNDIRLVENEEYPNSSQINSREQLRFRWINKKQLLKRIQKQCDWVIAQAQLPIKQRHPSFEYPEDISLNYDVVTYRMALINTIPFLAKNERMDAEEIVLLTAMAARAFDLEHGNAPRDLRELVPEYLEKIENDPFVPTQPLRYSASSKSYVQWSLSKPFHMLPLPVGYIPVEKVQKRPYAGVTGYKVNSEKFTLPFVLYSVGENSRDDGGMDFKGASAKPGTNTGWPGRVRDDIFAPIQWFKVVTLPPYSEVGLNVLKP